MRLKQLHIENYGPFANPIDLDIDDKVTILTGQNDVGKTAILKLIDMICSSRNAQEDDVNLYRIYDASIPWKQDAAIMCIARFQLTNASPKYINHVSGNLPQGDLVDILVHLTGADRHVVRLARPSHGTISHEGIQLHELPSAIFLPQLNEIRSIIDISNLNPLEANFLRLAFGEADVSKLKNLSDTRLRSELRQANNRLNEYLRDILPSKLGLTLTIETNPRDPDISKFILSVRDTHDGDTPLHFRGAGVRKAVALITSLVSASLISSQLIILYDEPENSLHADTQHKFRRLLESLTEKENIQVIYSTHSPSMINTFSRQGLRLLERTKINGKATSIVNNKPYQENFTLIRASLGLTPSDSLLYAPITVIVEGSTEILGISALLRRLISESVKEFEDIDQLMSQCHFIDGIGDSLEYWCRLARSQGSKPIVYVDGDKTKKIRQLQNAGKLEGVPVIMLDNDKEFEELVRPEVYFQALELEISQKVDYVDYQKWLNDPNVPDRVSKTMFSKKVDAWLLLTHGFELEKPVVMKRAIEISKLEEIDLKSIRELLQQIRILSQS